MRIMSKPALFVFAVTGLLWSFTFWVIGRVAAEVGAFDRSFEWREASMIGFLSLFTVAWSKAALGMQQPAD